VRFEAGAALVAMGEPSGYAAVVGFLSDADRKYRYKAIEALRESTRSGLRLRLQRG
jgi:HEAT repeat protein